MMSLFAEFLFSAILWGSLITVWLWRRRAHSTGRLRRGVLTVGLAWFALHTAIAWYGFVLPPSGYLVDADSEDPIKNARVVATWGSYPMSLWTSYCSGRQAHLSDEDGHFAFRLAPAPTLIFGTFARGLNPQVPGRIGIRKVAVLLAPLWGDMRIQRYVAGRTITSGGLSTACKINIIPQYRGNRVLAAEEHPFEAMYREACVERQAWTFYDQYLQDMLLRGPPGGYYASEQLPDDPRQVAVRVLLPDVATGGCPPYGNLCVSPIDANVHDTFCTYFSWLRDLNGIPQ